MTRGINETIDSKQVIQDIVRKAILDIYKCVFTGYLKINELAEGYQVLLGWNNTDIIFDAACDTKDLEKFTKFIREELRRSRLNFINYYTGFKYEKTD